MKKTAKIAFCIPYYPGSNHSQLLGVGYLSAYLKNLGHETTILDEDAAHWVKTKQKSEKPREDAQQWLEEKINRFDPDIIALSINTTNYHNGLILLKYLRNKYPDKLIAVGGPHVSLCWKTFARFHKNEFDIGIIGEGEEVLAQICEKIANNQDISSISSTFTNKSYVNNIINAGKIVDINKMPFPDRDGFIKPFNDDETKFVQEHYQRVFYSFLPGFREKNHARIVVTRGCNKKCGFCSPAVYWSNPENGKPLRRTRSPENIIKEIDCLYKQGFSAFYFDDTSFPVLSNLEFFNRFKKKIKDLDYEISWGCPMSSDEINEDILDDLRETGFRYTYLGLESWNDSNLSSLSKKQNIDHCLNMVNACAKKDIHCDVSYQLGLPHEDLTKISDSLDWLTENGLEKRSFFNITALWPETQLAKQHGLTPADYEPETNKETLAKRGLYYFPVDNELDHYFSNFSGTFHFIPFNMAREIKEMLFEKGFFNRFELDDEDFEKIEIK